MTRAIHIINSSAIANNQYSLIIPTLQKIFEIPILIEQERLDLQQSFDFSREQYNSGTLLAQITRFAKSNTDKWIGIVDIDLFVPVLTFVFGEAQFDGSVGIVSTHRLSNQFYGIPQNDDILLKRLEKEIIHELGHTFGLYHCRQFECVMRSSTYVEEIDLKQTYPCSSCKEYLSNNQKK